MLDRAEIPSDELNAWTSDAIGEVLPDDHPCHYVVVGQFQNGGATEMHTYPNWHKMPNGGSVSDWLGTARVAAEVVVASIERVRQDAGNDPIADLDRAEQSLTQALYELRVVRCELGRPESAELTSTMQEREQSLRMTIARLLDAQERYPNDMQSALEQGRAQLQRKPLWVTED